MSTPAIIINGVEDDRLSSLDRGLLYGDGVFETIAVNQGQPQYWQEHLKRLASGCEILGMELDDDALLKAETFQLIGDDQQCIIKIIITRGIGDRGYKPTQQKLTRIIQKFAWPEFPVSYIESGIDVTLCQFQLSQQPVLAKIKHLNRLEQVIARSEWDDEYQEGLVCDTEGHIIEATSSNVFFQIGNDLVTPDLEKCGVAGVMRGLVIKYCSENNINLSITDLRLNQIQDIEGMFVCNSIIGIWPVRRFRDQSLAKTAIITRLMSNFNTY